MKPVLIVILLALCAATCYAQNSSLYHWDPSQPVAPASQFGLPQASWTYMAVLPPKKIELHDPVVVRVDELARMQSDGELNRRKTSTYNAQLKDWLIFRGLDIKPDPQPDGDQTVQGQLQQQLRATSEMEARESLAFNITCEIIDIRPNGNLVLEGHNQINVNEERWMVSLSGMCRRQDIGPDNVVLSKNILNLQIDKRDRGQVRDGYRRGWFARWFDEWDPF